MRPGQHEPLVSFQTYERIQERLQGGGYAPRQKNVNEDFPLRGFVACADCGRSLTACWSKGSISRHPYYLCPQRGCESYGKSIRRDLIEGEFETLLQTVRPSETLSNDRLSRATSEAQALGAQLAKVDKQVSQLLERILDATVLSVIAAYEGKVGALEEEKLLIREKLAGAGRPVSSFEDTLRTALDFLANPYNL